MVKLFVGNLADGVDSHRLRNLFLQHVHVQECDVLKNFAFVHVVTEEDAETAIARLDKHRLEGREIHIERSTSRLRKEPGMGDKCFTCGAFDHKTPYCPLETKRKDAGVADNSSVSTTVILGQKRSDDSDANGSPAKKARFLSAYLGGAGDTPTVSSSSSKFAPALTANCKVGGGDETDPELPCPQNPELKTLYDQYIESRTRYFFYRERLGREINALIESGTFVAAGSTTAAAPIHLGTIDLTKRSTAPTVASAGPAVAVPPASTSQPLYVTGSQPQPQALVESYGIPQTPIVSYNVPHTPAVSYANPQSQPIPGQHIYVVPAHSQPQPQPQAYQPSPCQPPQQMIHQPYSPTVQQQPPQHSQPTVYQHQQQPTVINLQSPPTVYAQPPSNQSVISDKIASQQYTTYNATPPTAPPAGVATITRVDLTQSASGHGHAGSGPREPQFRIKINAPGVGTPPPRQPISSNNNIHNNNNNNNRPNNNNHNNNRQGVNSAPLLANLAVATVAALRAAPQLAAAAAAISRSGPTPLAQAGLGPRPLLQRHGGGGAPSPSGNRGGRYPPLMGRRN